MVAITPRSASLTCLIDLTASPLPRRTETHFPKADFFKKQALSVCCCCFFFFWIYSHMYEYLEDICPFVRRQKILTSPTIMYVKWSQWWPKGGTAILWFPCGSCLWCWMQIGPIYCCKRKWERVQKEREREKARLSEYKQEEKDKK